MLAAQMAADSRQQLVGWWVIWASFQLGIFVIYHHLTGDKPDVQAPASVSSAWLLGLGPVVLSAVIRWFLLPRVEIARAALVLFACGIALAEATCFIGIFIFPARKEELFWLSVIGIFQFIPVFARRYVVAE